MRRLFADLDELADRLGTETAAEGGLEAFPGATFEDAAAGERARVVGAGLRALEKVGAGRDGEVTVEERAGLEAIVLLEGRPPLMIANGSFEAPPPEWAVLEAERAAIEAACARVGRVEVSGHLQFEWVGTGFLVGPDAIMTNRHVAVEFAAGSGDTWSFQPGMASSLDFRAESGTPAPLDFAVTGIIGVHEHHDLALLRIAASGPDGAELPAPLPVAATPPADLGPVYVVGHPAWDGRRNEPEVMSRLFLDVYNVKRLQPGATVPDQSDAETLAHDCTTLGGNSGSPVLSLATHDVIGLHFGGRYGAGNYAVPLWTLVADPLLQAVNFR